MTDLIEIRPPKDGETCLFCGGGYRLGELVFQSRHCQCRILELLLVARMASGSLPLDAIYFPGALRGGTAGKGDW